MSFDLIIKYLSGHATPAEAQQLDQWKLKAADNQQLFQAIERSWYKSTNYSLRIPETHKTWQAFEKKYIKAPGSRVISLRSLAVAASLALLITAGYYFFDYEWNPIENKIAESGKDTLNIRLADATAVALFPGSQLTYPETFADTVRKVNLEGSASFKVSHDEARHFKVAARGLLVEVLGTEFDIHQDAGHSMVSVKTGVVKVSSPKSTVVITAKQQAWVSNNGELKSGAMRASFEFVDVSLTQIVEQLSRTFGKEIRIEVEETSTCKMSGSFTDESLENIINVVAATLNLTISNKKDAIILSGKTCY